MSQHPFRDVAIIAAYNTLQARVLEGHTAFSITLAAARGVLAEANVAAAEVDAVFSKHAPELIYALGIGPVWNSNSKGGIAGVLQAASLVATGLAHTVLLADGEAGVYTQRTATAPWTRPANEFVVPFGLYTAAEFALIARRHMHRYGTSEEQMALQMAEVAATIRNNGHVNPEAVYHGRGPFTPADVLSSRMITEPFRLLDCAMTSEGGCGLLITTAERAADFPGSAVYILGGGLDCVGPAYRHAPSWDLTGRGSDIPNGYVGRRAARNAFATAGLRPSDVDVCELYDPFSFEIIRQFEAFEFCGDGEGGDFIMGDRIGPDGEFPITTDGGLMSYSHGGGVVQLTQRVARGVHQLQKQCRSRQVPDAQVALCSNGGAGALFTDLVLLGSERP
ncbi:MAG: thiolase family protein [Mycobacterium sp.]|uniref:thiolase family protein n=1 Tax=Mycobacterium sp. TaxID=1785 RepID=UPI003F9AE68B